MIHPATAKVMIRELKHKMEMLEQSDDSLFTSSCNKELYNSWRNQVLSLERDLPSNRRPKQPEPYNPQTDTKINF